MITWVMSWPPLTSCPGLWKSVNWWRNSTRVLLRLQHPQKVTTLHLLYQPTKPLFHSFLQTQHQQRSVITAASLCDDVQHCECDDQVSVSVVTMGPRRQTMSPVAGVTHSVTRPLLLLPPQSVFLVCCQVNNWELWRENHVSSFCVKWLSSFKMQWII